MNDSSLMPFGIHEGTKLANVPAAYLIFIYEKRKGSPALRTYIEENMELLKKETGKK